MLKNMYQHFVVVDFRKEADPQAFFQSLTDLSMDLLKNEGIKILSFSYGKHDGSEVPNENKTHMFKMTFPDEQEFKRYLEHPKHKALADHALNNLISRFQPVNFQIPQPPPEEKIQLNSKL